MQNYWISYFALSQKISFKLSLFANPNIYQSLIARNSFNIKNILLFLLTKLRYELR